ncbi:helix-turn-helix transcriptional regulator [Rubrivirga sp. IMCC43871]|uniref:helix-turn-helix transcriptional regulator n=1 Tax=Rubrivirga sp. IMCC43871 TaxID=3391575 RepID=UPI0039901B8C
MALHLSSQDLARIAYTQAALLSPLAVPSAQAWGRAVTDALSALFHADAAVAVLPTRSCPVVTRNVPNAMADVYEHFLAGPARDGRKSPDPAMPYVERVRRARGLGRLTFPIIDRILGGTLRDSPFFNETAAAMGAGHLHGLYLPRGLDDGEKAQVEVYHVDGERSPFGDAGVDVLALLAPAFEAGAGALARLDGQRAVLDALAEPAAAFDGAGRIHHENAALGRALGHDAQRAWVLGAARALARDLGADESPSPCPFRTVETERGRYRLRGTLLPRSPFGPGPGILITVEPPAEPWPEPTAIRARFGLTRREAEVALLLARGLTNDDVADRLCISPHTARRHTERVMAKLDVPARAQVAAAVLVDHRQAA